MKVNQQLIADRLKLSRTTVSRCFTNHPKINPETRAAVFQLAAELGYEYRAPRNVAARKPDGRNTIAVLIGVPESRRDAVNTAKIILKGIFEKAAAMGLNVAVHYVDAGQYRLAPRARRILPGVSSSDWKGVVLLYPFEEQTVGNLSAKFPVISVLDDYDTVDVDCINPDEIRGITRMVQRLYDLGHRRIGFMSWKYTVHAPWVERRFGSYVENLYRLGLEFDPRLAVNMRREENMEPAEMAVEVARLTREAGVTAWVCAADHQAYQLMRDLAKLGIRVPKDCSVTGFDGIKPPRGMPQLTTVRTPFHDIGVSCLVSLQRRMDHPSASRRHILVDCREVPGKTTRAVKARV
ncbi:MAG: LacI family transcriptional regulator [Verrucomicrobia bacterium]|nr:MAG: LacI family transcriptional regulator [Verrucomicrobiota bacterium]